MKITLKEDFGLKAKGTSFNVSTPTAIALIKKGLNNVGIYDENKSSVDEIEESINRELESNSDE